MSDSDSYSMNLLIIYEYISEEIYDIYAWKNVSHMIILWISSFQKASLINRLNWYDKNDHSYLFNTYVAIIVAMIHYYID